LGWPPQNGTLPVGAATLELDVAAAGLSPPGTRQRDGQSTVLLGSSVVDMLSGPSPPHQFSPPVVDGAASAASTVELGREVSSLTV